MAGTLAWVEVSLYLLAVASAALAAVVLRRWLLTRQRCHLYWGGGLVLVAVTIAQEAVVYGGTWSSAFLQTYFFLVAALVGILALGSAELGVSRRWAKAFRVYTLATIGITGVVSYLTPVSSDVLVEGVIAGTVPVGLVVASSLVTFPASGVIVFLAGRSAWRQKRWQLLYIVAGILVIVAAGSLYIASFPATLYYAEFLGVVLLMLGFLGIPRPAPVSTGIPRAAA